MASSTPTAEKFMKLPAVMAQVSLQKSAIYAGIKNKTFPAPIKLGTRSVAWTQSSINHWINERIRAGGAA
jgi:prophage regulatory protein